MPAAFAEPYDIWPDKDNNMWIADGAMGGAIIKFDQKTEKFTFYPAVQRGDLPKIEITRECDLVQPTLRAQWRGRRALSRHDQDDDVRGAVLSSTSSTDKQEGRRSTAFS
jgi:hypothetical protein